VDDMTMYELKNKLITTLESNGFPCYLQGSLLETQEYPPSFWTYWTNAADETRYDNKVAYADVKFTVYFYSNDPSTIDAVVENKRQELEAEGFLTTAPLDALSDEKTHIGQMFVVMYKKF